MYVSVERKYVTRRSGNYGRFPSGRQHGKHATGKLLWEPFNFTYTGVYPSGYVVRGNF